MNIDTDMGCARDAVHLDYFSHNLPVFSRTFLTGGQTPLIHVISDSTVTCKYMNFLQLLLILYATRSVYKGRNLMAESRSIILNCSGS